MVKLVLVLIFLKQFVPYNTKQHLIRPWASNKQVKTSPRCATFKENIKAPDFAPSAIILHEKQPPLFSYTKLCSFCLGVTLQYPESTLCAWVGLGLRAGT